jgi:hypothetical protein
VHENGFVIKDKTTPASTKAKNANSNIFFIAILYHPIYTCQEEFLPQINGALINNCFLA